MEGMQANTQTNATTNLRTIDLRTVGPDRNDMKHAQGSGQVKPV